jgi:hypothetical protein
MYATIVKLGQVKAFNTRIQLPIGTQDKAWSTVNMTYFKTYNKT